ncbi:hypothetical protein [Vreelandella zhaodongensis]|uniref:hypothetical protein n=1 Tax=Vreelandella zhaodongensis TaxID=1176240 RepID=UPI003EBCB74F
MPRVIYLGLQAFANEPQQLLPTAENPLACESLADISVADAQEQTSARLLSTLNDEDAARLREWCKQDAKRQLMIAWPQPDAWLAASLANGAVAEEALNDWLAQAKRLLALFRSARRQITLAGYLPGAPLNVADTPITVQGETTGNAVYQLAAAYLCGQSQTLKDTYAYLTASSQECPVEAGREASVAQAALSEYHARQAESEKGRRDGQALQEADAAREQQQQVIARLKGELSGARDEYAVVFQQLQTLQESLAARVDEQKANSDRQDAERAKYLEQSQQQIAKLQKDNAQLTEHSQQALTAAQKESAQLLSTLQQAQQAYETLNQEYQALAERKENQIAEQQRLINAQQQNMDSVVTKLERRAAEVQKIQQQLEQSTLDNAYLRQQLEKRQKEFNILRSTSQQRIHHLERLTQWLRVHAQRHAATAYRESRRYKKALPKQLAMLEASPLFNADWYLEQYPDVAKAGIKPAEHFIKFGAIDGRNPGPQFNTDFYLTRYADVAASGQHPLLHYLRYGIAEQRETRVPQHHLPAPQTPAKGGEA